VLQEMEITLVFKTQVQKEQAKLKLKDCVYRQDNDPGYMYKICRVNDDGH